MKVVAILVMAGLLTLPATAADRVTVAKLEQIVAASKDKPDKAAAKQIGALSLGERISDARFEKLMAELPGPDSQTALLAMADASQFLDLPAADIPATPPPSIDEALGIVLRAVQFAANSIDQMPNLLATRETTKFQQIQFAKKGLVPKEGLKNAGEPEADVWEPFKQTGRSLETVVYREGREVVENAPAKKTTHGYDVTSRGEFGEFLGLVITDMAHGKISWSHWEANKTGTLAVFDFDVPKEKAHYQWSYCCAVGPDHKEKLVTVPAPYHAEIAIAPKTGAVMRLMVETYLESSFFLGSSEVVEYGPVEIGGQVYICPVKNIVLGMTLDYGDEAPDIVSRSREAPVFRSGLRLETARYISVALNHSSFQNYHVFRSEVKILPDAPQDVPEMNDKTGSQSQH